MQLPSRLYLECMVQDGTFCDRHKSKMLHGEVQYCLPAVVAA